MNNEEQYNFHYQTFYPSHPIDVDNYLKKIKLKQNKEIHLQIINPKFIVSEKQILVSIYHTLKAFKQNRNKARDIGTEFLLRISGQKQISSALEIYGINETSEMVMIIAFGGEKEENKEEVENFMQQLNLSDDKLIEIKFPILSIKDLSLKYQCEEDILVIEKRVLEEIASSTIL